MTKDNLLYGIVGLLLGSIIGFMFANSVNQTPVPVVASSSQPISAVPQNPNPNLPPDHPQISGGMGGSMGAAPMAEVTEAVKKAEEQPDNFDAQLQAGDLYYEIQRFDQAAKFYERASKLRPDVYEAAVKAGNAYFDAEQYETAEKYYVAALAKNPDDINVRTDLGLTFYLRQPPNIDRAISEYQTSLKKNPNHELSLQNLAVAFREKGDAKAAQETLDKLAKINPNNPLIVNLKSKNDVSNLPANAARP
jgi:tetratricopeptide (TPR) repeat protein